MISISTSVYWYGTCSRWLGGYRRVWYRMASLTHPLALMMLLSWSKQQDKEWENEMRWGKGKSHGGWVIGWHNRLPQGVHLHPRRHRWTFSFIMTRKANNTEWGKEKDRTGIPGLVSELNYDHRRWDNPQPQLPSLLLFSPPLISGSDSFINSLPSPVVAF